VCSEYARPCRSPRREGDCASLGGQHGFNKQTLALFWTDLAKSLVLGAVLGAPVIALVVATIRWGGPHFYIYVWAALFGARIAVPSPPPQPRYTRADMHIDEDGGGRAGGLTQTDGWVCSCGSQRCSLCC
jgi:hypothetical protein